MPRHQIGVAAKAANADHRIVGLGIDIHAGREVDGAARATQRPADGGGGVAGGINVVEAAQHSVAREWCTGLRVKTRHVAAFLVHGDDRVRVRGGDRIGQGPQLRRRGDVLRKEADTSQPALSRSQPAWQYRPRESGQQSLEQGLKALPARLALVGLDVYEAS